MWNAAALLLMSFMAVVAVQMADVSILDDLRADLILAIGATQLGAFLWIIQLRAVGFGWASRMLAFLGLEAALSLIVLISVPWHVIAGGDPEIRDPNRPGRSSVSASGADLLATSPHDSPAFRGTRRDGVHATIQLESDWSRRPPRQLWRKSIGAGWSSFAVVGDYCLTQEQRGEFEAVVCYELLTGRECWSHQDRARFAEFAGGEGPRATPAIHGGRVYALGATGILNCLQGVTGKPIWSVNILDDNGVPNCRYGMAGSPLVIEPYVIVSPGGTGTSLVAYHCQTGKKIWSGGAAQASYSSPQPATLGGEQQVVIFNADGVYGHKMSTGEVRWHFPWISNPEERNNVCQPVILPAGGEDEPDLVFISSGYGKGCALLEVRRTGDEFSVKKRWSNRNLKAKFTSVVVHGQYVYGLDERILTCIGLTTGKRYWKRGRFGFGQLLLVDDLLIIQAETGDIVLVKATPNRFHELGRFAALDGRTWNQPALAGRVLLVRNDREAACYELPLAAE